MSKVLRPSVIARGEWYKGRDDVEWKRIRQQALDRDLYTCVYCGWQSRKFMQVNHIGAEDDHTLANLETVCPPCHSVLHLGASAMKGALTVFACIEEAENVAAIVNFTRDLVGKGMSWPEIEHRVLSRFLLPGGDHDSPFATVEWANQMVRSIVPPEKRGYLPSGYAVIFHEEGVWERFPERVWKWQCKNV